MTTPDSDKAARLLEAFIEIYGSPVYWWGTSDSPNTSAHGIDLGNNHWLVLTPYLKDTELFIQVLHENVVGLDS